MIPQKIKDMIKERYEAHDFPDDMTPETFKLHIADHGGYDICDDITLELIDEKMFLIFRKPYRQGCDYSAPQIEEARFELRVV